MAKPHGLWLAIGGGSLAEAVANSIETQDQFTISVTARDVKPRSAELVLVSLKDSADYIGISQRGRRVATGQMTLVVSRLAPLARMTQGAIREALPKRLASRFKPPATGQYRPSPQLWEELLKIVSSAWPEIAERIRELARIAQNTRDSWGPFGGGLEIFERDAVASALEAWRGAQFRKRMLRSVVPAVGEGTGWHRHGMGKERTAEAGKTIGDQRPGRSTARAAPSNGRLIVPETVWSAWRDPRGSWKRRRK